MYQKIGNFFIGIAPMFFGAGLLFVILRIAYPHSFIDVAEIREIPKALRFAFSNTLNPSSLLTMWTPIVALIAVFVCPYMHMSWADIKGAVSGALTFVIIAFILSVATVLIPIDTVAQVQTIINSFVTHYIFVLALGLIISLATTLCFGLLSLLRGKGL